MEYIYNIIRTNTFKKVALIDTYDYDYDPSLFPNLPIDIFFKRYKNKNKQYGKNVFAFPISMFVVPCVLWTILNKKTMITETPRKNAIMWCGSLYDHIDDRFNQYSYRRTMFNNIHHLIEPHYNLSEQSYLNTIEQYKIGLDLKGVGAPNKRTFELMSRNTLIMSNMTDLDWGFEHSEPGLRSCIDCDNFDLNTLFDTPEEFKIKSELLLNNEEAYTKALNRQNYLIDKYMNKDYLRNYILRHIMNN
jgi:hypothetical protein